MDLDYRLAYLSLSVTKGVGAVVARYIHDTLGEEIGLIFGDKAMLSQHLPRLRRGVLEQLGSPESLAFAEKTISWAERSGVEILTLASPLYPERLAACPDAPIVLYYKGNLEALQQREMLSIVGTRRPSTYGLAMVEQTMQRLSPKLPGLTIISGLAFGIDIAAHRKAIEYKLPTIAVLAHGLSEVYPVAHRSDAEAILMSGGGLLTEYPPQVKPDKYLFIARNRIIAGLSPATLVVEAGERSGSISTANLANAYDREVFAYSGRLVDPMSYGTNHLIATQKAQLLCQPEELLSYMGWQAVGEAIVPSLFAEVQRPDDPILGLLSQNGSSSLDELIYETGLSFQLITEKLFDLEMDGLVQALPGGRYKLR